MLNVQKTEDNNMKQNTIISIFFCLLSVVCCPLSVMAQTEVEPFVPGTTIEGVTKRTDRRERRMEPEEHHA